jgi:hypothetical protein
VAVDTYHPVWEVMMPEYFHYNVENKDEFTIVILDQDTEVLRKATEVFSQARLQAGGGTAYIGVQGITEATFNQDDRLARWTGKIPAELLRGDEDADWELSFDRVTSLKMKIEKRTSQAP